EEHLGRPPIWKRAEHFGPSRLLDGALRFEIEGEVARATDELHIADRAIPMNQESDLRLQRRGSKRALPAACDLDDDVVRVFRKRERDSFGRNGQRIVSSGWRLAWQRL